jgi:hypothetical protein
VTLDADSQCGRVPFVSAGEISLDRALCLLAVLDLGGHASGRTATDDEPGYAHASFSRIVRVGLDVLHLVASRAREGS